MTNVVHAQRKHSDYAASSSHRWLHCPASVVLSKTVPPKPDTKYSIEGTKAHECLEELMRGELAKTLLKKYPQDMVNYALDAQKAIEALKPSPSAKLLIETKVDLSYIEEGMFGTLDYAWVDEWGELTVIDYKYGSGVAVFPCEEDGKPNPQLMYYALGLSHKYEHAFSHVRLAIIQPRVWQGEDDNITKDAAFDMSELSKFEIDVRVAVALSKQKNLVYSDGEHCRWCPVAATCPEISENKMRSVDLFVTEDKEKPLKIKREPQDLSSFELPKFLKAANALEIWIEQLREHAFFLASTKGEKIEGYKLVQKRSTRVWLPESEQKACALFENPYKPKEFMSPAQLEAYAKELGRQKEAKAFTKENTTDISSGVTLVPDSDKRTEVKDVVVFDF